MSEADAISEDLHRMSESLDVLGNAVRLRIFFHLGREKKNVSQIADELDRSASTISRHRKIMRYEDIFESKTEKRERFYRIKQEELLETCEDLRSLFYRDEDL